MQKCPRLQCLRIQTRSGFIEGMACWTMPCSWRNTLAEQSMLSTLAIARRLPDLPRWVEVRDILFGEDCEVFGFQEQPELSFAVPEIETSSVFVIGRPAAGAIRAAIESYAKTTDVIAPWENATWLAQILPGWSCNRILVHALPDLKHLPLISEKDVRFLKPTVIDHLSVPEDLLHELQRPEALPSLGHSAVRVEPADVDCRRADRLAGRRDPE